MTEGDRSSNCHTTLDQRRAMIALYLKTSDRDAAMRAAGVSRTTFLLWWKRYHREGDDGLRNRSRARRSPRKARISAAIVESVRTLRREHPRWGRRRIAREVAAIYGGQVISPAWVGQIMRKDDSLPGGSKPESMGILQHPLFVSDRLQEDVLIDLARRGIEFDVASNAAAAAGTLHEELWQVLDSHDVYLWPVLLKRRDIGPLLLRSRVELVHSLINVGRWSLARRYLDSTLRWMLTEQDVAAHAYNLEQVQWSSGLPSLRRDDILLELWQYTGVVLRDRDRSKSRAALSTALSRLDDKGSRRLTPSSPTSIRGVLEHDLAKLKLRAKEIGSGEIRKLLAKAEARLEETNNRGMLAGAHMGWAALHRLQADRAEQDGDRSEWLRSRSRSDEAVESALRVVESEPSPMLQTNFFIDAAVLHLKASGQAYDISVDAERLGRAADYCVTYGYGGQAKQLLGIPGIEEALPDATVVILPHIASQNDDNPKAGAG